jgi:peroxiredoxin
MRGALVGLATVLLFATNVAALEVGQKAPDFTLQLPDGKPIKLGELTAKGPVAMYTFIQAFTGT